MFIYGLVRNVRTCGGVNTKEIVYTVRKMVLVLLVAGGVLLDCIFGLLACVMYICCVVYTLGVGQVSIFEILSRFFTRF